MSEEDIKAEAEAAAAEAAKTEMDALKVKLEESEASNKKLTERLGDPDVVAVIAAKDGKKSLRVVVGDEAPEDTEEAPPAIDPVEVESMTNSELVEVILKQVPHLVKSSVQDSLGSLDIPGRLDKVDAERKSERQERLTTEAEGLLVKYPDLLEDKDELIKLAATGLKLEEAYLVNRVRKGKGLPTPVVPEETATETPTDVTLRAVEKETPARQGSRGFSLDLEEVLERMVIKNLPGN